MSDKPLLLIYPFDLLSHYLRCLELAKVLQTNYSVLICDSEKYRKYILAAGFQTFSCRSLNSEEVMECARKFDFSWINENNLEPVFLSQVRTLIKYRPALVLGDTSPTLKMAAEKEDVKFISLMNGYMSKYYGFVRKLSRTHKAYNYTTELPEAVSNFITKNAEALAFRQVHIPFKRLRNKYQLPKMKSYLDELEGDLNLLCDLPELFPQKKLPINYRIIAPLYYRNHEGGVEDVRVDKKKKTIYASMGSTGDWEKLAFLNDDYFARFNVITAGDYRKVLKGPHISSFEFINTNAILPFVDLVICHGGNGTIYQALENGVPLLCITSHFEQEWNVAAIERSHLGKSLDGITELSMLITVVEEYILKKEELQFQKIKELIEGSHSQLQEDLNSLLNLN